MRKRLLILFAALILFAGGPARAEDSPLRLTYDGLSRTVQIRAGAGSLFGQAVTVVIAPEGTDPATAAIGQEGMLIDVFHTGAGGTLEGKIKLPDSLPGGKYIVYLTPFSGKAESFIHVNAKEVESVLPALNRAKTVEELENVLLANGSRLGIDSAVFSGAIRTEITKILAAVRPASGFTEATQFLKDYGISEASALIKSGGDIEEILEKYQSPLEIDFEKDYGALREKEKGRLDQLLRQADLETEKLGVQFGKLRLLACVQTAESWKTLKTVLEDNEQVYQPDKTYYSGLVLKDKVYQALFERQAQLQSISGLRSQFCQISKDLYDAEHPSGGSTGGGSGPKNHTGPSDSMTVKEEQPTAAPAVFSDLAGHWAKAEVERLAEKGIVSGFPDNTFRPEQPVTRAEFVKLIISGFSLEASGDAFFDDVPAQEWYEPCIAAAASLGIVTGDGQKYFWPEQTVTRQDAAVMLKRALDLRGAVFEKSGGPSRTTRQSQPTQRKQSMPWHKRA